MYERLWDTLSSGVAMTPTCRDTIIGIAMCTIGGFINGFFTTPTKFTRKHWPWENSWFIYSVVGMQLLPWAVTLVATRNLPALLAPLSLDNIILPIVFGMLWGVGQLLFGTGVERLGSALGFSLVLSLTSTLGSVIPLVVNHRGALHSEEATTTFTSLGISVVALVILACAGLRKESEQSLAAAKQRYVAKVEEKRHRDQLDPLLSQSGDASPSSSLDLYNDYADDNMTTNERTTPEHDTSNSSTAASAASTTTSTTPPPPPHLLTVTATSAVSIQSDHHYYAPTHPHLLAPPTTAHPPFSEPAWINDSLATEALLSARRLDRVRGSSQRIMGGAVNSDVDPPMGAVSLADLRDIFCWRCYTPNHGPIDTQEGLRAAQNRQERLTLQKRFFSGLFICILSGCLSPMGNVAFDYGMIIASQAESQGINSVLAGNIVATLKFSGGVIPNVAYVLFQLRRNKSFHLYKSQAQPRLYLLSLLMAVLWFAGQLLYSAGAVKMGKLGAVLGYSITLSSSILAGQIGGILTGEWHHTTRTTRALMFLACLVIASSIVVQALGTANSA